MGRLISDRMSYRNHYICSGEATSVLYFTINITHNIIFCWILEIILFSNNYVAIYKKVLDYAYQYLERGIKILHFSDEDKEMDLLHSRTL